jgi:hypothetical protein
VVKDYQYSIEQIKQNKIMRLLKTVDKIRGKDSSD